VRMTAEVGAPETSKSTRDARLRVGVLAGDELRKAGMQEVFAGHPFIAIVPVTTDQIVDAQLDLLLGIAQNAGQVFEIVHRVLDSFPKMRLIIMALPADRSFMERVLRVGAHGYLTVASAQAEIEDAIAYVYEGARWLPPEPNEEDTRERGRHGRGIPAGERCTERELQVLKLLTSGQTNRGIAHELKIEERTVKSHIASLLKKMNVRNRTALTMKALSQNLVNSDDSC